MTARVHGVGLVIVDLALRHLPRLSVGPAAAVTGQTALVDLAAAALVAGLLLAVLPAPQGLAIAHRAPVRHL